MREILFKAKRRDNGEWAEGSLVKSGRQYFIFTGEGKLISNIVDWIFLDIDKNTICQYTGLTDKNGQKIWENDIVKYTDMITYAEKIDRIEWNETHASFVRLHKNKMGLQYLNMDEFIANRCEVIGNIFDNPELINE